MSWSVVYKKAIQSDGSLLFPERLTKHFLDDVRKVMGSYKFANQYQNEVIPDDEKRFKTEWIRGFKELPENTHRFAFIDPAIGQKDKHDFTAICVIDVDYLGNWYLRIANRYKITPTELVSKIFDLHSAFKLHGIGIESVAYQEALLYFLDQEMKRRQQVLPIKGIKRSHISKETRILGLVPRFEWERIFVSSGLKDFEDEYTLFPRASHDDIMDALASLEEIVYYPQRKEKVMEQPHSATDPNYEKWYIQNIGKHQSDNRDQD